MQDSIDFQMKNQYNFLMQCEMCAGRIVFPPIITLVFATSTEECYFNGAYFNATYINNYGDDERAEKFVKETIKVANVIIRLDSLIKSYVRRGLIKNFLQYELIDNYAGNFRIPNGSYIRNGKEINLRLTDSIALNKVLKEIWRINDYTISPNVLAHTWLFSLHIGICKTRKEIIALLKSLDINYNRPDIEFLWLRVEGDLGSPMAFYQRERDGFYHGYIGLYLTKDNVMSAKELIEKKYCIKTTITSHFITPQVLKRYLVYVPN